MAWQAGLVRGGRPQHSTGTDQLARLMATSMHCYKLRGGPSSHEMNDEHPAPPPLLSPLRLPPSLDPPPPPHPHPCSSLPTLPHPTTAHSPPPCSPATASLPTCFSPSPCPPATASLPTCYSPPPCCAVCISTECFPCLPFPYSAPCRSSSSPTSSPCGS